MWTWVGVVIATVAGGAIGMALFDTTFTDGAQTGQVAWCIWAGIDLALLALKKYAKRRR